MKKQCHRTVIEPRAPMMALGTVMRDLSLAERSSVLAFESGWATVDHFNALADMRDMLALAAEERGDKTALVAVDLGLHALLGVKERFAKTNKFGMSGEELKAMRVVADISEAFWLRQSGNTFARHYYALCKLRSEQHKGKKS